ncbi:MAG TPA: polysaccharide pyruvyl transferase family protein [Kiritimatiellia bacterium]|nr:polysaccharide pyruvyl transferase family protein [Kiritimatiellia bacterium]HOR98186.1 polysaccharide pyruvyl transferase family protein [Kiritimatiellia bacterium]HPC49901.1 polysaccharide pyruvyl transferase family protein [Kiritimatiellia bacterium]HRU19945.1 polysaccharide pyruvyl transferase family protein [Kiritimatiellia bacterium]
MNRRLFLKRAFAAGVSLTSRADAKPRAPRILLRSSWQVVNIGDIAHTPGVLALIEKHLPGVEVILWASGDLTPEVAAMEHRRFPKLKIVKGRIGANGDASTPELAEALTWCDFLLHGSGPSLVAHKDVAAFVRHVRKPFGVYGITYAGGADPAQRDLMSQARFLYFRDSVSLGRAREERIASPEMGFAPDGAFGCDLRNDAAAEAFLRANRLEPGRFLCCIPRLRNTPYWKIRNRPMNAAAHAKHARNEALKEQDHAPLREAICAVTRTTGLRVLVCPEDMSQMAVGREMLVNRLPEDVRRQVVWRESFWLTDEALSTYVRSAGLFGLEMHSPILCIGNGIPAIVCRFAEQTSKGFMWRDIGLDAWLFDFDQAADRARLPAAVLDMVQNPADTRARVAEARKRVEARQRETMAALADTLGYRGASGRTGVMIPSRMGSEERNVPGLAQVR